MAFRVPVSLWPALEIVFLFLGALSSFILAAVAQQIDVTIYETKPEQTWVQSSPLAATATAAPRSPVLFRSAFVLLGLSFLGQAGFVWLRWRGVIPHA